MLEILEQSGWTPEAAAHLLNRAGFGGSPAEISALHALGHERAVDSLLKAGDESDLFPVPPASVPRSFEDLKMGFKSKSEDERRALRKEMQREGREQVLEMRAWWLNRMRWSPFAAREKAALFWHGHWATSFEKVKNPFFLWQQNETLRAHALGAFGTMAREISRDPAMMQYLDLTKSKREQPNENFARELMELFTLGEGNYTERDIRESARAFTGYRVDPRNQQFFFFKTLADGGEKTFFGKTGNFSGDDIIRIILADPRASKFLARKIWTFYAAENPPPPLVEELAARYRASGLNNAALLRAIFLSREFYSPEVVRRQIKSPVQWLVQTCKSLEVPLPGALTSAGILRQLGQELFAPPNVKGWDGGRAWISAATLLLRYNIAGYIVSGKSPALQGIAGGPASQINLPMEKILPAGSSPEALCDAAGWRLFQARMPDALRARFLGFLKERDGDPGARRDLLHLMMSTPDYQTT